MTDESSSKGLALVGVDGSPSSREALRWAAREARLHGWRLHLVHAYRFPLAYAGLEADPALVMPEMDRAAHEVLAAAVADAGEELEGLEVETTVAGGHGAAAALVAASEEADVLVVGARGVGGLHGLLLGSVSQQVAQHAHCPVVIVRETPT